VTARSTSTGRSAYPVRRLGLPRMTFLYFPLASTTVAHQGTKWSICDRQQLALGTHHPYSPIPFTFAMREKDNAGEDMGRTHHHHTNRRYLGRRSGAAVLGNDPIKGDTR
jgi:hypothetical protein